MFKQPFIIQQLSEDIAFVETNSPDVLIDLGLLLHIMGKRIWYGSYKGWTDVPATWFAEHSRMRFQRVKNSLERLVEWGLIIPMSTNNDSKMKWARRAPRYRYDLRNGKEEDVKVEEKEEEVVREIKADDVGAYGEAWVLDRETWQMRMVKIPIVEYNAFPVCQACGKVYHPTEGASTREGICAGCGIVGTITRAVAIGMQNKIVNTIWGERSFSLVEMRKYLENWPLQTSL